MPNGGITPDCLHCKHFQGKPYNEEESFCSFHQIKLASPIRAFCCHFTDPEPQNGDWLDHELERSQLREDMMYFWLGGYEKKFFHVPLVSIVEYKDWTWEQFLSEARKIADKYRDS